MNKLLRDESGALLYVFAIMFPVILMLFALAVDGTNAMRTKARLNDGVKQGLYGVTVVDLGEDERNSQFLGDFIQSYLPNVEMDN